MKTIFCLIENNGLRTIHHLVGDFLTAMRRQTDALPWNALPQEAKSEMIRAARYNICSCCGDPGGTAIAIYEAYRKEMRKNNALDFDDLLLEAVRLLKVSTEVRERLQRRWRYLLVDEYQDTNRPQYELMKLLAGEKHNVCAVGD